MAVPVDTLLLSRRLVAGLATSQDYLLAVHRAFAGLASQDYVLPSVGHVSCGEGTFHIKCAGQTSQQPRVAIKINGNFPGNPFRHGLPTIQGFIALLDAGQGSVLALMDSIEITARRTAAATALAARHLAKQDAEVAGIIGCGRQARYHVEALRDVAAIRFVKYCDPREEAAVALGRYLQDAGIDCERVLDAGSAARGADIVVTLTPSTHPVLSLADVGPGAFVAGVGADNPSKHELAPELLRGSHVVPDLLTQSSTLGDLHHAIELGQMTCADIHAELADVVAGTAPGRTSASQRFVFDSTGIAVQDLAAAQMIYERARQHAGVPAIDLNDLRSDESGL